MCPATGCRPGPATWIIARTTEAKTVKGASIRYPPGDGGHRFDLPNLLQKNPHHPNCLDSILQGKLPGLAMKNTFFCVITASIFCTVFTDSLIAETLVTISCDQPKGSSIAYGVSVAERLKAAQDKNPEPTNPTLSGPTKDGFEARPTFIVDSNRKKITIVWNELEEDTKLRREAIGPSTVGADPSFRWHHRSVPASANFGHRCPPVVDNDVLIFPKDGHGLHQPAIHGPRIKKFNAACYLRALSIFVEQAPVGSPTRGWNGWRTKTARVSETTSF
jgi:hypothetical protein